LAEALAGYEQAGGWESLTAAERAVSLLVAGGLTNGAMARRRCIWPHTVNTRLRHVFAKLGVSNRAALAAWCITRSSDVLAAGRQHNQPVVDQFNRVRCAKDGVSCRGVAPAGEEGEGMACESQSSIVRGVRRPLRRSRR
jgi:DNA-binding CsgD family transcriptional regulator